MGLALNPEEHLGRSPCKIIVQKGFTFLFVLNIHIYLLANIHIVRIILATFISVVVHTSRMITKKPKRVHGNHFGNIMILYVQTIQRKLKN